MYLYLSRNSTQEWYDHLHKSELTPPAYGFWNCMAYSLYINRDFLNITNKKYE